MSWAPKDPSAAEFFVWDFTAALAAGDSVAALVGVTVDSGGAALIVAAPSFVGNTVIAKLSAGTLGVTYNLRAEVLTVLGETLELTGILLIRR